MLRIQPQLRPAPPLPLPHGARRQGSTAASDRIALLVTPPRSCPWRSVCSIAPAHTHRINRLRPWRPGDGEDMGPIGGQPVANRAMPTLASASDSGGHASSFLWGAQRARPGSPSTVTRTNPPDPPETFFPSPRRPISALSLPVLRRMSSETLRNPDALSLERPSVGEAVSCPPARIYLGARTVGFRSVSVRYAGTCHTARAVRRRPDAGGGRRDRSRRSLPLGGIRTVDGGSVERLTDGEVGGLALVSTPKPGGVDGPRSGDGLGQGLVPDPEGLIRDRNTGGTPLTSARRRPTFE